MINEVTIEHINRLTDIQLSKILHNLIEQEFKKNNIKNYVRSVPFNITTADEGEDGRAQWTDLPISTKWLKNRITIFQNKATDLPPGKCMEEILIPLKDNVQKRKLKMQIEKLVKENGCYVLFTNRSIVEKGKKERIKNFREAIHLAGEPNFDTFQILIYDSNDIKDWVNEFTATVTLVQSFNGITRPHGFRVWDQWEKFSKCRDNDFQVDETIKNNIKLINLIDEEKCIRVTGHSGLGKSRLVLEAFRDSNLKSSIVYYDLEGNDNISGIKDFIISHQDTQNAIIVIDNCDSKRHNTLSKLVKNEGDIKIITIGFDDDISVEDVKIKIERDKQRNIVKDIVLNKIGKTHQQSDINYITAISEGYPSMAIKFCDIVIRDGMSELTNISLKEFTRKLIHGNDPKDNIEYEVIKACSVFSSFGFLDDSFSSIINQELKESLKAQMDFIRTKIYDGNLSSTHFNQICNRFLEKDIIEKRGIYYIVKPTVLAINLAAEWLLDTDSDRIIELIQELKQVGLDQKFVNRLKDLDQIDKAKEIVKELWGPAGPFGSAEVLNTSWGSQLFRSVVEVNPIATSKALQASFGQMTKDDLYDVDKGRRNLVWALEKLCFRAESFDIAAKILFSFAVSDNETWGNNSTNQFKQLFQLFLSGTEVSLERRLDIIRWGLAKNDDDYTQVAIEALGRGLSSDHFMRMGGPEKQGSNAPLKDYYPQDYEIAEYWKQIVSILTEIACSKKTHATLAQDKIANSIRGLSRFNQTQLVIDSIKKIIKFRKGIWTEALNNLKMTLSFESHLPMNIKDEINALIEELVPNDLKNQLFIKVTKPEWEPYDKDDEDFYVDKPKINSELLAKQIIDENLDWTVYLKDLLEGEQRQAFNFGKSIGELIDDKDILVQKIIKILRDIPIERQNPELLAGIISNLSYKAEAKNVIDQFLEDEKIRHHSFYLTKVIDPSYSDLEKLFILIDNFHFSIDQFQTFQYGRALDVLTIEEMLALSYKISTYGKLGKWTSLSILFMYCFRNEEKWEKSKDFFRNLLSQDNMTIENRNSGRLEKYHWSEVVTKILFSGVDRDFAVIIAKQIIEFCSQKDYDYSFDSYISNVISILLEKYFDSVWRYFGEGILGDYFAFFHLEQFIGTKNGYLIARQTKSFLNPEYYEYILEWCRKNTPIAAERMANMMPLNDNIEGKIQWHPFSRSIIDEFGDNDRLLSQLSSNMGTFGTQGSRVPYFETQKQLLEELLDHPIERVRVWASNKLEDTIIQIKKEKLDDEQYFLD